MRRVLARLIPSPALGVALAALLLACGGFAYAASPSEPVIRACANKRTGVLRLAKKCKRNERHVSWGIVGPQGRQGPRGLSGARGLTGASGTAGQSGKEGAQGPAGPGASSFATTVEAGAKPTLATLTNGVTIAGSCGSEVEATFMVRGATLQMSGTQSLGGAAPIQTDFNTSVSRGLANGLSIDFNGVVRGSGAGKFAQVVLHGEKAGSSCTFWGVVIPSS